MAFDDENWNVGNNANYSAIDALSPVGAFAVTFTEFPSASLNVKVAPGAYMSLSGVITDYLGTTSQAIPTGTTKVLYLTPAGVLTVAASYPTTAGYIPLAVVVAGATTITSITDDRSPAAIVGVPTGGTLINAANDSAAATAGVAVGGLYRNGSVVQVRVS